jgi:Tat protein translocase TatB subunit
MGIGNIGWTEFLVILAFALIFFGPRRLPGIAQSIGKTMREFQKALNEVKREVAQADQQATDAKSYMKSILPPSPLSDEPASTAEIPEDSEPEVTSEAEIAMTPRAPAASSAPQAEDPSATDSPGPPADDSDTTAKEADAEDGDTKGKDVA